MNAEPIFLDTNIIVYAYSTENENKRKVARSLVDAQLRIENPFLIE